jgi:hypothetical protein
MNGMLMSIGHEVVGISLSDLTYEYPLKMKSFVREK